MHPVSWIPSTTFSTCCGCHQPAVRCILLLRIYNWAVVILVRLGCCIWELACDSEKFGCCGKSPTNSTRNLTSFPVYDSNEPLPMRMLPGSCVETLGGWASTVWRWVTLATSQLFSAHSATQEVQMKGLVIISGWQITISWQKASHC